MKRQLHVQIFIAVLMWGSFASALDLVPATSEDIDQFDQQLARQREAKSSREKSVKPEKSGVFGQSVSEEAKKLKDKDASGKQEFGQWVSSQRKKNDTNRPDAAGKPDSLRGGGPGKDAAAALPKSNASGSGKGPENSGRGRGRQK